MNSVNAVCGEKLFLECLIAGGNGDLTFMQVVRIYQTLRSAFGEQAFVEQLSRAVQNSSSGNGELGLHGQDRPFCQALWRQSHRQPG